MNEQKVKNWVREWLILTAAIMCATVLPGISANNLVSLFAAAAIISFFNAFFRPILILISMPFVIATFGLGIVFVLWGINSLFLFLAGELFSGFHVASVPAAMCGALFISVAQIFLNLVFGNKNCHVKNEFPQNQPDQGIPPQAHRSRREKDDNDVIDI